MSHFFKIFLIISFSVFLSACGEPTIDASSEKAMEESTEEVFSYLEENNPELKSKLEQAILAIMIKYGSESMTGVLSDDDLQKAMTDAFDGKTAEEIIEYATNL